MIDRCDGCGMMAAICVVEITGGRRLSKLCDFCAERMRTGATGYLPPMKMGSGSV